MIYEKSSRLWRRRKQLPPKVNTHVRIELHYVHWSSIFIRGGESSLMTLVCELQKDHQRKLVDVFDPTYRRKHTI